MTTPKAKPYKLKPSDGAMTRDDVSLWEYTLLAACRQVADWQQFLPGNPHSTWIATDVDPTNGLNHGTPLTQTKLRNDFAQFLTCVATHCPTGFIDTVMRESTSFREIVKQIKTTYGLDSRGEKFLSCMDIKFEFSPTFTYEQGFMQLKDFFMASLLPVNHVFKTNRLQTAETLSPLAENFIMKEFLTKVHPKLPDFIKTTKGHLFTADRPTLACNKAVLIDMMDSMLAEIEGIDSMAAGNLSVANLGQNRQYRGGRGGPRPPYRGAGGQGMHRGGPRGFRGGRPPFSNRFQGQGRREDCYHCVEARRFDSSKGHLSNSCPFKLGQAAPYQHQGHFQTQPSNSGMKILLVQDSSNQQVPAQVPAPSVPLQHLPMNDGYAASYQQASYPQYNDNQLDHYYDDYAGAEGGYDDGSYDHAYHGYDQQL